MKAPLNKENLKAICLALLTEIGEDPTRDGLKDTPRRFADWWEEFINYQPGRIDVKFETSQIDQLVIVKGLKVWSLCEHHLLPFHAKVTIAYISNGRLIGLSKMARVAHLYAHGLQVQERLVNQIADEVQRISGSPSVAVLATGKHLCMEMRGIKTEGEMVASCLRGLFKDDPRTRAELFELIKTQA